MTNMAGEAIEIQRLKSQIRTLARGNAVDLMELGKSIYDRYKAGEEVEESAQALCDAIRDRESTIGEYEKKISKIKGASECSKCGKMVGKDMAFCPYCGEKVASAYEEDEDTEESDTADETAEDYAGQVKEKNGRCCGKSSGQGGRGCEKSQRYGGKSSGKDRRYSRKGGGKDRGDGRKSSGKDQ